MSLPTLLKPGSIEPASWMSHEQKQKLATIPAIKWILEYLKERVGTRSNPPKLVPKTIGWRVGIFRSGTGTGKSTVFPPEIYKEFIESTQSRKTVICTQPTVVTTIEIPNQIILYNKNLIFDKNIGYQTGTLVRKPIRGILFSTVGILLQHLKTLDDDDFMKKYQFIIIDEIHNRTIDVDTTLFMLKEFLTRNFTNPDCPYIILTSGTFDPTNLMKYFDCPPHSFLDVKGNSFPIIENFPDYQISNYIMYIADLIAKIHTENYEKDMESPIRDIMVFMQGSAQMNAVATRLHWLNANIFSKGLAHSQQFAKKRFEKYVKGGGKQEPIYISVIHLMSENIDKAGEDYQNLFAPTDLVTTPIYKFDDSLAETKDKPKKTRAKSKSKTKKKGAGTTKKPTKIKERSENLDEKSSSESSSSESSSSESESSPDEKSINVGNKNTYEIDSLSNMPTKIKHKAEKATRRIILSTNAAETGLTIDTLKYCIDSGYVQEGQFNPTLGVPMLLNKNVSQANARQRRGRIGRKAPGEFFACYSKEVFDSFPKNPYPEIIKNDITNLLLDVIVIETETKEEQIDNDGNDLDIKRGGRKTNNIKENDTEDNSSHIYFQKNDYDNFWYRLSSKVPFACENLKLIQSPSADNISYSIEKLHGLGFIDYKLQPTLNGWYGSKFRKVSIENIRMILAGYQHGANILDLITIACFIQGSAKLGIKKQNYTPRNPYGVTAEKLEFYFRRVVADEHIEYIFMLDEIQNKVMLYGEKNPNVIKEWCDENNVSYYHLAKIIEARDEIILDMLNIGLNPFYNGLDTNPGVYKLSDIVRQNIEEGIEEIVKIKKCIYEGYRFELYAYNLPLNQYISLRHHNTVILEKNKITNVETEVRPYRIIVTGVSLRYDPKLGTYEFKGGDVSVMDDFVDLDLNFLDN